MGHNLELVQHNSHKQHLMFILILFYHLFYVHSSNHLPKCLFIVFPSEPRVQPIITSVNLLR